MHVYYACCHSLSCYAVACHDIVYTGCSRVAAVVGRHLGQRHVRLLRVWRRRQVSDSESEQGAHRAADNEYKTTIHQPCAQAQATCTLDVHTARPRACPPAHVCVHMCVDTTGACLRAALRVCLCLCL